MSRCSSVAQSALPFPKLRHAGPIDCNSRTGHRPAEAARGAVSQAVPALFGREDPSCDSLLIVRHPFPPANGFRNRGKPWIAVSHAGALPTHGGGHRDRHASQRLRSPWTAIFLGLRVTHPGPTQASRRRSAAGRALQSRSRRSGSSLAWIRISILRPRLRALLRRSA